VIALAGTGAAPGAGAAPGGGGYGGGGASSLPRPKPPRLPGGLSPAAKAQTIQNSQATAQAKQMQQAAKTQQAIVAAAVWHNERVLAARAEKLRLFNLYDAARAAGQPAIPSLFQPSNPKAFLPIPGAVTQKPSGMFNAPLLASTIGLTESDRKFMADALTEAAKSLTKDKVTAAALAKEIFEGAEFADVLSGGPLPDRDDFKDRFVAGLNSVLTTKYKLAWGFAPDRKEYASAPRRDPKLVDEVEAAIVPTSACLRCHDVRPNGKAKLFEPIPPLHFDPFDKQARADWVRTADPKRKLEVLAGLSNRLYTDADMPPSDAPEHGVFRVKQAAAFADLKRFLDGELAKARRP
jgi:hypothetical protein